MINFGRSIKNSIATTGERNEVGQQPFTTQLPFAPEDVLKYILSEEKLLPSYPTTNEERISNNSWRRQIRSGINSCGTRL
ncbi:MAG: hypothetical protein WA323_25035 [Candidatus Nitrosopolaris sp.]